MNMDVAEKILFTEDDIKTMCKKLGRQLTADYQDKNPIFVCTLKGGFMFFADLVKEVKCNLSVEYIKASSYIGAETSGNVDIKEIVEFPVQGKDIVLVEDIVDTGLTAQKLISYFLKKGANSVEMVAMLDKKERRRVSIVPKYIGFSIPDYFVIGYGLDYNEKYRNLPFIGIMNLKYIEN